MVTKYGFAKVTHPVEGITRRILANSAQVMLTEHILDAGAVLPIHNHPHEQLVFLLSGQIIIEMSGSQYTLKEKDSLVIAPDVFHKAIAIKPSVALDIFIPAREDYL
jgi:quercetin dioxygenase-like cupin family protein